MLGWYWLPTNRLYPLPNLSSLDPSREIFYLLGACCPGSGPFNGFPLIFFISNHTLAFTNRQYQQLNQGIPFGSNFIIRFGTAVRGRTIV